MPDITMCPGEACPLRQRCYRYRAIPDARQDAFTTPPFDREAGTCASFWELQAPSEDEIRQHAYFLWVAAGRPENQGDALWHAARTAVEAQHRSRLRDGLP